MIFHHEPGFTVQVKSDQKREKDSCAAAAAADQTFACSGSVYNPSLPKLLLLLPG